MSIPLGTSLDDPSIKTPEFELMPPGEYYGKIDSAEETESQSGKPMIKIVVKLQGNQKYDGKLLFHYFVFDLTSKEAKERTLSQAKNMMMALNQDITGLNALSADMLLGLSCKVKTKHDTYINKDGDQVTTDKIHYFVNMGPSDRELAAETAGKPDKIDLGDDLPF